MFNSDKQDTMIMVNAAHRYCLGRRSYIVSTCMRWLTKHWANLDNRTKLCLLRDTIYAIMDGEVDGTSYVDEWKSWAKVHFDTADIDLKHGIIQDLLWKKQPMPFDCGWCLLCNTPSYNCTCNHEDL